MISSVRGRITQVDPDAAVIEVAGVGLRVSCTPGTLASVQIGQEASLVTSLVVREDSLTLYGFVDDDERGVFETLQTASGVGPRLAQAVLACLGPDDVRRAIAAEDVATLTRVPGIGRKGAQRLVLELKDRLGPPRSLTGGRPASRAADETTGALRTALAGLGYTAREIDGALAVIGADSRGVDGGGAAGGGLDGSGADRGGADGGAEQSGADLATLLRAALRVLGPR